MIVNGGYGRLDGERPAQNEIERPWFFETPQANLFNEWTWTHFFWGMLSTKFIQSGLAAMLAHTGYESVEGMIFPSQARDVSMLNHVGDSVAFLAGRLVAR